MEYFGFIFFGGIIIITFIIIISLSIDRINTGKKILKKLSYLEFTKIDVTLSQNTISKGRVTAGMYTSALLYLNKDLIIITPKQKSVFNISAGKLPIIIAKKTNDKRLEGLRLHLFKVSKIKITSWGAIYATNIRKDILMVKRELIIRAKNKKDKQLFIDFGISNWIT